MSIKVRQIEHGTLNGPSLFLSVYLYLILAKLGLH